MLEFLLVAFVIGECIVFVYLWIIAIKHLKSGNYIRNTTSNYNSYKIKNKKINTKANKKEINQKKKSSNLPGVHEDYDEELQKELIKEEKYDSYNFEEEDLEEDDYHFEDDN